MRFTFPTLSVFGLFISVFLLGDADYTTHFYPRQRLCFISDAQNVIIAKGTALPNHKLFFLSDFSVLVPPRPSTSAFAHYASR